MSTTLQHPQLAADAILAARPNFTPKLGLILGSGLGSLADQIENPTVIPYQALPGFPISSVVGHAGRLILGHLNGLPIVCLQGRVHFYEGIQADAMRTLVRTLKLIGCEMLLITNASGSLRTDVPPGRLMAITDHINFQWFNPLVGPDDESFGPRFMPMNDAYDPRLRERLSAVAKDLQLDLAEGVYIGVLGPSFETPAEIRAFRTLGADAVGMSTVPEVIVARHCGLRVAVVAAITNFASGMVDTPITHDVTLTNGALAARDLAKLVMHFAGSLKDKPC